MWPVACLSMPSQVLGPYSVAMAKNAMEREICIGDFYVMPVFIFKYPKTTKVADFIYRTIQRFDKKFLPRLIKHRSKMYLRCNENMILNSVRYAKQKGADIVCLGHTHHAVIDKKDKDVWYYNSGCWTEKQCSYLSIKDGVVELNYFS